MTQSRQDRERQLDLFGEPMGERRRAAGGPGPAAVSDEQLRVAGDLPPNVYLGTSSWSFPGWAGLVYDRDASKAALAREGLAPYSRHPLLRAVGLDRTFYAPLPAAALASYAADVPDDFRFLVKAPVQLTSLWVRDGGGRATAERNPHFLDRSFAIDQAVGPYVEGLGSKGGALVFQFPPLAAELRDDPPRFAALLGEFLSSLPPGPVYAVELRDRELFGSDYLMALERSGATHCLSLHPRMPAAAEQGRTAAALGGGPLIARWMLHASRGYEDAVRRYSPFSRLVDEDPHSREQLARSCVETALRGRDVILTANNKAEGSAPLTVFKLAESIARRFRGKDRR